MRAFLIDPVAETVSEIATDGELSSWYATLNCSCIDIVSLSQGVDIVIDDEGRLIDGQRCFEIGPHLIAGRALVVGCDRLGEVASAPVSLSRLASVVRFLPEHTDYEPPAPVVVGFTLWAAARCAGLIS